MLYKGTLSTIPTLFNRSGYELDVFSMTKDDKKIQTMIPGYIFVNRILTMA